MKTIRVRIAVAVTEDGEWCCSGRSGNCDEENSRIAKWGVDEDPHRITFVEADVLLPDFSETTIEGEVRDA